MDLLFKTAIVQESYSEVYNLPLFREGGMGGATPARLV